MRVLVVEDELHNSRMLIGMIQELRPQWQVVHATESIRDTVSWLQNNDQPDIIFMDIQLSDGICFNIFEQVKVGSLVVFTTAYDEYAIQSFKVNSIDYLLKPIKEEDLKGAIEKFERFNNQLNQQTQSEEYRRLVQIIKNTENGHRKRFMVSGGSGFLKIDVDNIALFVTEDHATFAITYDRQQFLINFTMEKLEQELDPERFFRCSRSTIINIDAVYKVESGFGGKLNIELLSGLRKTVKVSRLKASIFKSWIDK